MLWHKDFELMLNDDKLKFLKHIIDTDPNLIFIKDINLKYVFCNKAAMDFYGITEYDQIIGKETKDIIKDQDELDRICKSYKSVIESGVPITTKEYRIDKNGKIRVLQVTRFVFDDHKKQSKYIISSATDITTISNDKKSFGQIYDFFTEFLDNIPASVFILDESGNYVFINKRARDVFGIDSQNLDYMDSDKVKEDNYDTMKNGVPKELIENIISDGMNKKWATVKMPLYLGDKKYLVIIRFVDMDKEVQDFHEILLSEMEKQTFFSMTTFISGITHEFRTPLQSLRGGLELILAKIKSGAIVVSKNDLELIKTMLSALDGMNDIVNNLINFGLVKGNYQPGEDVYKTIVQDKKQINIKDTIKGTIDIVQLTSLYKENMQDGKIIISGDSELTCFTSSYVLRNILINLINNSIKAIAVRSKYEPNIEKIIKITFFATEEEEICIEVEDNGIGIDRSSVERLFSPFFRANREIPGVGIGLFTSKFWATSANMDLKLKESTYGKTIFNITIRK